MSGIPDEPLRWERDSDAEAAEAHRAAEQDRLDAWARDERLRPLTDALEAHGLIREQRESWGRYVVPQGWAEAEPPEHACPWCQAPAEASEVCAACRDAQAGSSDPPARVSWWESLDPIARRLHLSACHGIDPWTGRAVSIGYESVAVGQDGLAVTEIPLLTRPPRSSWDDLRGRE